MEYTVDEKFDGRPLRELLRRELHISARLLARLKRDEHGMLIDGERVTVRHILHTGERLSVCDFPDEDGDRIEPVELPIGIVYEDEHLIVVDKPPFMPTHPSHDHHRDTLANALAFRAYDDPIPFVFRPVSRLDRNTSGLVTVAKNKYVSSRLNRLMRDGGFHKTYFAILDGVLPELSGELISGMRRTAESIIIREVCDVDAEGSETAITRYETLAVSDDGAHSLVRVSPLTGRTHQIRVHMASLGAPILGDDLYGKESALIQRQALHAGRLCFVHPISGESLSLEAPLPSDMARVCDLFFGSNIEWNESEVANKLKK